MTRQKRKSIGQMPPAPARGTGAQSSAAPPSFGQLNALLALALVGLVFAVFWPVRNFDFITWDDPRYVFQNPHVVTGLSWENVRWAFQMSSPYFHPITWISHMIDASLFGVWAGGHHLMAVSLHSISTVLLFTFLYRATGAVWRSAFVAAIFAIHPMRVESVAWVAERKDILPALALMIALNAYLSYVRRPSWWRWTLVTIPFVLGMLAKPILITFPFALLAMDLWPLTRFAPLSRDMWPALRRLAIEKLPWMAMSIGIVILNLTIQVQGLSSNEALPLAQRVANVITHYVQYLAMMVWPSWLNPLHQFARDMPPWWALGGAVALLAGLTWLAVRVIATRPYVTAGWFWFLATLVPVIGFIQAGDQGMADRFSYTTQFMLYAALTWTVVADLAATATWRRAVPFVAVAAIAACALTARTYLWNWKDGITLWRYSIAATPDSHRSHANLADALNAAGRFEEAEPYYRSAIRMAPAMIDYRYYYGVALSDRRRLPEAIAELEAVVRAKPADAAARDALGLALVRSGRADEAIEHLREAMRLDPKMASPHTNMFVALAQKGDTAGALAASDTALRLDPANAQTRSNRGALKLSMGLVDDAIVELREAQRLEPYSAERHLNLAKAYIGKGQLDLARQALDRALTLQPDHKEALNTRGVVLAELRQDAAAIADFERLLRLDPGNAAATAALNALRKR